MHRNWSVTNRFPQESRPPTVLWAGPCTVGIPGGVAPCPQFPPGAAGGSWFDSSPKRGEVVLLLQGFLSGWKRNNRVPNLIALQLVPADLNVHDRHIEGISSELLEGHPDHPAPADDGADYDCQADFSSKKWRNSGILPPSRLDFSIAMA